MRSLRRQSCAYAISEAGRVDSFALKTKAGTGYSGVKRTKLWIIQNGNEAEIFILFATVDASAVTKAHGVYRPKKF